MISKETWKSQCLDKEVSIADLEGELSYLAISTVQDEYQYWLSVGQRSKNAAESARSAYFAECLQPIISEFTDIT